jgi:hypothetical protein
MSKHKAEKSSLFGLLLIGALLLFASSAMAAGQPEAINTSVFPTVAGLEVSSQLNTNGAANTANYE